MPFIRQTRDKRGFEHTFVMHAYHANAGGPSRPRVLYLFCSPSNLRVGRTALDAEVMEALEHTHPDLSFDWGSISREFGPQPQAGPPNDRQARRQSSRPQDRPAPRPPTDQRSAPAPVAVDTTVLGRVLGASEAARLRARYGDLVQRIGRRARTPEERDRLLERARRLNPDDWSDEAGLRAQAATVDAAWDAIGAELPSRRRGRRGGRRRSESDRPSSAIMATANPVTDEGGHEHVEDAHAVGSGGSHDAGGERGAHGAIGPDAAGEAETGPEIPVGD